MKQDNVVTNLITRRDFRLTNRFDKEEQSQVIALKHTSKHTSETLNRPLLQPQEIAEALGHQAFLQLAHSLQQQGITERDALFQRLSDIVYDIRNPQNDSDEVIS